jgi:hypothetical protein
MRTQHIQSHLEGPKALHLDPLKIDVGGGRGRRRGLAQVLMVGSNGLVAFV